MEINTTHELKIETRYFEDILCEIKKFEIRRNNRFYKVNDQLLLREIKNDKFTGRSITKIIGYISDLQIYKITNILILGFKDDTI